MALYYLETSALAKLYVREAGTERMLALLRQSEGNKFALLSLTSVELRSAIRRRQREGDISVKVVGLVLDRFQQHIENRFLFQIVDNAVIEEALGLTDRHDLRAYDALQLAGCLSLRDSAQSEPPVFASADQRLLQAARSEQLSVFDPRTQN